MKIDKQQIIGYLTEKGDRQKADKAEQELPQEVDTEDQDDVSLLEKLGIDPMELAKNFLGGKGIPGL